MEERKRAVRQAARAARDGVRHSARASAARAVAARALVLPAVLGARTVLAYAATPGELDPAPLVAELRARGALIAYPRVCGPGALALHRCDEDALAPGYRGIAEPPSDAPTVAVEELDLVLVPGTAFDATCGRLGAGGGFYDRMLPALRPGTLTIGLAFDEQIVVAVPTEAHDVPLDVVITPSRTLRAVR